MVAHALTLWGTAQVPSYKTRGFFSHDTASDVLWEREVTPSYRKKSAHCSWRAWTRAHRSSRPTTLGSCRRWRLGQSPHPSAWLPWLSRRHHVLLSSGPCPALCAAARGEAYRQHVAREPLTLAGVAVARQPISMPMGDTSCQASSPPTPSPGRGRKVNVHRTKGQWYPDGSAARIGASHAGWCSPRGKERSVTDPTHRGYGG